MSTQSLASRRQGSKRLPAFSLLGGILITWLALSSTAFAVQLLPGSPSGTSLGLLRAGVSVVRLLATYNKNDAADTERVYCTGLGVIVASWPVQNASNQKSWILTDSSLVNANRALCANEHPQATLLSIEVSLSTAYNNQQILNFSSSVGSVICQDKDCHSGPALFALDQTHGQLLPFLDLAQQQSNPPQEMAIKLMANPALGSASPTSIAASLPLPSITAADALEASLFQTQAEQFLIPSQASSTTSLEAGTPLINSNGQLTSLSLTGPSSKPTPSTLRSFIEQTIVDFPSHTANPVHDGWQHGIDAYVQKDFSKAQREFQAAANANPHFQAAKDLAVSSLTLEKNATSSQFILLKTITIAGVSFALWQVAIPIVVLLAIVVLGITLLLGKSRRRSFKADLKEANRQATLHAQQIAEMEAAQQANALQSPYEQIRQQSPALASAQLAVPQLPCPRCGERIPLDASYCPSCRLVLSPSESGLHLRAQVISQPAGSACSLAEQPTMPSPMPAMPSTSIAEQPTMPSPLLTSIVEQPTVEIISNREQALPFDQEKTEPYSNRQGSDMSFQLVVGTRSDPGIKRKYKPNEDSLFAVQGSVGESPMAHSFGLFVIADGMGGHANGQDASRLAIQTIIEHILPKLVNNLTDEHEQLIKESIQSANLAVHQRNIEQHGDMGTTVTGALVMDNVAYVANVGDSRTYLYRASDGLKKITNDHSVVASLVEAGIIKPDDIYTHPKRNHIYRSLGEKTNVEVDGFAVPLQEGDKLLLCSDGLWDMVRDPKIEDLIKNPVPHPSATADVLIQAAYEGGGEDNVSVIVIEIGKPAKVASMPRMQLLAKPDTVQMPQL